MSVGSSILALLLTVIKSFFTWLTGKRKAEEKKEKIERIEKAESKLKDACDNGNLANLIDASINLGKERKK